jgi:hypothetical protein
MAFEEIVQRYLSRLQEEITQAYRTGQYTPELSYRPALDEFFLELAQSIDPHIRRVFEPKKQAKAGRPDWRFYNEVSLGVYGYVESKGLDVNANIPVGQYQEQVNRYLTLGSKVILTDGIEFIFFDPADDTPRRFLLVQKPIIADDWTELRLNLLLEGQFRIFFEEAGFRRCSEEELIRQVAQRAVQLSKSVQELSDLPAGAGLTDFENRTIDVLRELKTILEEHHDPALRTPKVFADFVAQVLIFGLLYAHRIVTGEADTPIERSKKIQDFWFDVLYDDYTERLRPFRALVEILGDELETLGPLGTWYQDCLLLLAYIELEEDQRAAPDYHELYESFIAVFDPQARFDFGIYYTPSELAQFAVKLTQSIIASELPGTSLYEENNKLIDPCCGTGTFLEQLITHSGGQSDLPSIIGFEILPAPYALAHYRLSMIGPEKRYPRKLSIVLTNTLSDELERAKENEPQNLIEAEQAIARELTRPPLTLIIGNPPSSDSAEKNDEGEWGANYEIIKQALDDFRPPPEDRTARQNTQKQLKNKFVKFLRWSCAKLEDHAPNILTFVLPASFAEHPSYRYARRWMASQFNKIWVLDLDLDARTGMRASSIFKTMQGRILLAALTNLPERRDEECQVFYGSIAELTRSQKLEELTLEREPIEYLQIFRQVEPEDSVFNFRPAPPFDTELYSQFWPLYPAEQSPVGGEKYLFSRYCSGLKLAPSSLFIHVNEALLIRRSREIANQASSYQTLKNRWYAGQDKPPAEAKFAEAVRREIGQAMEANPLPIRWYTYRPLLNIRALISKSALQELTRMRSSGTRVRPEVLSAYDYDNTIGIAVAPAPKDIGERLHRFASFCWTLPDNDLCKRGDAKIYCNQFPEYKGNRREWNPTPLPNVNQSLVDWVAEATGFSQEATTNVLVYYVYGILCSDAFLDAFEGALFTVADVETRPRIPIPEDVNLLLTIAQKGEKLALLEKPNHEVELNNGIASFESLFVDPFKLDSYKLDADKERIDFYSNEDVVISIFPLPKEVLEFQISGYNVLQQWLKMYSYNYKRAQFSKEDYLEFLKLLYRINLQIAIVRELDEEVSALISGEVALF